MPQHLFLCPDTGRPHFILSESICTDGLLLPSPHHCGSSAVASCQALLRGRQLPLNVQIQDGTGRQPPEWVHGGFTCVKPTGNGLILFYLTVLNAVASKWLLLLTRVIICLLFDHSKYFKAAWVTLETHGCKGGPLVKRESARLWSHSKQKTEGHFVHFWRNNIWEIK